LFFFREFTSVFGKHFGGLPNGPDKESGKYPGRKGMSRPGPEDHPDPKLVGFRTHSYGVAGSPKAEWWSSPSSPGRAYLKTKNPVPLFCLPFPALPCHLEG